MYIVSSFIGKQGYKKEVSQFINAKDLDVTSEIEIATPSINIIPPTDEKINISDEKNSTPLYEAAPDVTHQDNVAHAHYESEDVDPKKENGALDKGASDKEQAITIDMPKKNELK